MKFTLLIIYLLLITKSLYCDEYMDHQIVIGTGKAFSLEDDLYRTGSKISVEPDFSLNLEYNYNINSLWAFGVNIYGYMQDEIPTKIIYNNGDTSTVNIGLSSFNEGVKGKYYFMRDDFQPYLFANFNFSNGKIKGGNWSANKSEGVSFGGGAGMLVQPFEHFGFSVDAIFSFGGSQWNEKIFRNSEDSGFQNGFYGFFANLVFLW
jgi:hypothetical protein